MRVVRKEAERTEIIKRDFQPFGNKTLCLRGSDKRLHHNQWRHAITPDEWGWGRIGLIPGISGAAVLFRAKRCNAELQR